MEITNRQKKIIGILLESKDTITCQEIAEIINVSDRTVLNEVNSINKKLSDGNRLTVAKGKGIKLNRNTTIYELHKLYNSEDENEILIKRFINTLLINNYFKQKKYSIDFIEELYISQNTLKKLIRDTREVLKRYQIDLIVNNKEGIFIEGRENNIRLCMSNILFSSSSDYEYFLESINLLNIKEIDEIKRLTLKILNKYDLSLTGVAFNSFVIHILISIIRNQNEIGYDKDLLQTMNKSVEKDIVRELMKTIKEKLNYDLSSDYYYLTKHLITSQKFSKDDDKLEADEVVNIIYNNIISRIKRDFSIDFSNDEILTGSLKIHLTTSINRYMLNSSINHIDLSEIKSQYPIAYDMGIVAAEEIHSVIKRDIDDTEILFLALHLGTAFNRVNNDGKESGSNILIVCGAGLSTARFLKYSLLEKFDKEIKNIDIISSSQYKDDMFDNYDLVLSSINNLINIEGSIKVNYILNNIEVNIVKNKLRYAKNLEHLKVFNNELFYKKSFESKKEVLDYLTTDLSNKNILNKKQIESIYDREKMGNTCLGNSIAIPHPLSYTAKEMKISVLINDKAIKWDNEEVFVVMLLLIPKDKIKDWDVLFKKMFKVFSSRKNVDKLINSNTLNEFKEVFMLEMEWLFGIYR